MPVWLKLSVTVIVNLKVEVVVKLLKLLLPVFQFPEEIVGVWLENKVVESLLTVYLTVLVTLPIVPFQNVPLLVNVPVVSVAEVLLAFNWLTAGFLYATQLEVEPEVREVLRPLLSFTVNL